MHHHGRGVPIDIEKAREWYIKAANQGNQFAQTELGIFILFYYAPSFLKSF